VYEEVNRKCLLGTRWYIFKLPTPTLSATRHSVTDRQTDRRQCHANRRCDAMRCDFWTLT